MALNKKQADILRTAEKLFAENGYEGTSVRQIAKAAGINVAMISYYFGSKEKLLQRMFTTRIEETSRVLEQLKYDTALEPWEKLSRIIDYYVDRIIQQNNFHTIVSRQISLKQDPATIDLLIRVKMKNTSLISEIIREGQEKGLFCEVNIPLTIGTIIGTVLQVAMSRPLYSRMLQIPNTQAKYFTDIRPLLKDHLKGLLSAQLHYQSGNEQSKTT